MRKIYTLLFFACAMMLGMSAYAIDERSQAYYDYESRIIQSHADGSYVIRAFGRSRNMTQSYQVAQKKALQDVIFHGVKPASSDIKPLKPLCFDMNAETKYEDYFNAFFAEDGPWKKFVSMKDRRINTTKYVRTENQMTAQVTVTVYRAELKAKLQEDGISPK